MTTNDNCGPTFRSEFKRGLNLYNLSVALIASLLIGAGALFLVALENAVFIAVAMFLATTILHTIVHSYFGWRFARGIRASIGGDHERAVQLLAIVERAGMDHYDLGGNTARMLAHSRSALQEIQRNDP